MSILFNEDSKIIDVRATDKSDETVVSVHCYVTHSDKVEVIVHHNGVGIRSVDRDEVDEIECPWVFMSDTTFNDLVETVNNIRKARK